MKGLFRPSLSLLLLLLLGAYPSAVSTTSTTQTGSTGSPTTPMIVLKPSSTLAGGNITVYGRGFTPNWTAWIFSPDFGDEVCCFETSSSGSFAVDYTVLPYLQTGVYTIRAVDQKGNFADARVTILSQSTSTTATVPQFTGGDLAVALVASLALASLLLVGRTRGRND